jgi:hypothetical protein
MGSERVRGEERKGEERRGEKVTERVRVGSPDVAGGVGRFRCLRRVGGEGGEGRPGVGGALCRELDLG